MKELEKTELLEIDGGKVAYANSEFGISSFLYNAAVSIRNFFGD